VTDSDSDAYVAPSDPVEAFWKPLKAVHADHGYPSYPEISRGTGKKLPATTVHGWFKQGTVPRWEQLRLLLQFYGEPEHKWRLLWQEAYSAKSHRQREPGSETLPEAASAEAAPPGRDPFDCPDSDVVVSGPPENPGRVRSRWSSMRRRPALITAGVGLIVILATVGAVMVTSGWRPGPASSSGQVQMADGAGSPTGPAVPKGGCNRFEVTAQDLWLRDEHGSSLVELTQGELVNVKNRRNPAGLSYWYVTTDSGGQGWLDPRYLRPRCP